MSALPALALALPVAGAVLTMVAGRRAAAPIALACALGSLGIAALLAHRVWSEGPVQMALGDWAPPLGIAIGADGLTAAMLLLTGIVGLAVTVAAVGDLGSAVGRFARQDAFWPLWLLLWAALVALFAARDVFSVYVALELVSLGAVGLVILGKGRAALEGAWRYLMAAWLGATAYLLGVALVYAQVGVLDMDALAAAAERGPALKVALALMSVGLLMKAALVPLHFWLPRAHGSAPAPVSAALSGLVVTASFVVMLRLWSYPMGAAVDESAAVIVGGLGVAAILWGGLLAVRQKSLKLMVAYSTVAQVGYLFLIVPMAAVPLSRPVPPGQAALDAWTGGTYHAFSHGVAKASLFLAAGCMVWAVGTDRIDAMRGLGSRLPLVAWSFAIAGVALVGLPPTGGFVAKWYLVSGAIRAGEPWWALAVLAGSLLTAAYVLGVLRVMLMRPTVGDAACAPLRAPRAMQAAALGLALVCLVIGLRPEEGIELLTTAIPGAGIPGGAAVAP